MSRPIKFRAWDGNNMIMPKEGSYYQHYVSLCGSITQRSSEGMDCFGGNDRWRVVDRLQLMQFTGLHDKNGVEIYEGDVIKDHNGVATVDYSDRFAAFRANYTDPYCKWFYDYNLKGERESIEVIGNIYQNPELLERTK